MCLSKEIMFSHIVCSPQQSGKMESSEKSPENFINCRNLDIDEIQKMKIEPNSFSLFQINSCSVSKNFEKLEYLTKATNKMFGLVKHARLHQSSWRKYLQI